MGFGGFEQTFHEIVIGGESAQTLRKHLQSCLVQDSIYFHAGLGKARDYPEHLKTKLKDDLYCFY